MSNICFINSDLYVLDGGFTQIPEFLSASGYDQLVLRKIEMTALQDLPSEPYARRCPTFLCAVIKRIGSLPG